MPSFIDVPDVKNHLPFVELVVIVSVPPALSVHPLMVGEGLKYRVVAPATLPVAVKLVHVTVTDIPSILSEKFKVPAAVTNVPPGSESGEAYPPVPVARSMAPTPNTASTIFLRNDIMYLPSAPARVSISCGDKW
jgi:hypothetical protein